MKNEKILTVIKGQEFKLSLKDKIEINDIFYDQYLNAAGNFIKKSTATKTADFFMDTSLFIFPDFGLKSFDILSNLTAEKQHTDQVRDSHHRIGNI